MAEFLMPSLGADMEAGTLVEWKRRPGDKVSRGDIIAEVETDKGIIEVEVFVSGVVERLLVEPGTKVPVGTALAVIREEGAPLAAAPAAPAAPRSDAGQSKISPAARRRAAELGVDPRGVSGTGPEGAVTLEDVERAAAPPAEPGTSPGPSPDSRARMRQAIGSAMARSKREIPHYYVSHSVDVTPALRWMAEFNARAALPDRLIPSVLFLKSVALALRKYPAFNGFWVDDHAVAGPGIHVGAAISLRGGGLVAPALRDADRMSLSELMNAFRDLVTRARAGTLRSSEMSDPTITVTSLGDRGTETVTGVIYPPQLAIVGFGRVLERPWVEGGAVVARSVVHVSLAADHRATDGHEGALFVSAIAELLTEPDKL